MGCLKLEILNSLNEITIEAEKTPKGSVIKDSPNKVMDKIDKANKGITKGKRPKNTKRMPKEVFLK